MSAINYDDVVSQLKNLGLILDKELLLDTRVQRWKVLGEDREKRGWSRLREWTSAKGNVYIVGNYGVWHGNDDGNQKVALPGKDDDKNKLSADDIANMRAAQKEAQRKIDAERKAEVKIATKFAQGVWLKCKPCVNHEYLTRKQIKPHGLRQLDNLDDIKINGIDDSNKWRLEQAIGALLVPMHDADGEVCGLQFIYPWAHPRKQKIERDKEFWPTGMAMGGSFGLIGAIQGNSIILLGEGYATMASLHEATGFPACYAFSANNLAKAAKSLRKKYPRSRILFCADDDYKTAGNPGVTAVVAACAELEQTAWIKPDFSDKDGNDRRADKKLSDFNDLYIIAGNHLTLANQVNAQLDELKWRAAIAKGGGVAKMGSGEGAQALSMLYPNEVVSRFSPVWSPEDVFYFDHQESLLISKASITGRMRRHGWDIVQADADWQNKPEVPIHKVGFDPGETDTNVIYNMWTGWPITPKAGDCSALCDLLAYMCSKEKSAQEIYTWMLRWLAYPLQNPGAKLSTSLVFHGPQGVGKNLFFESYAKIYGDYARVIDQEALEDKFNEHYSRKLFLIADEVVARGELFHQKNKLKGITTGNQIRINPKGRTVWYEKNQINLVYLSNEQQPIVLEEDDRRYCVVLTPEKLPLEIYQTVKNEIANGGIEAFYDYLLQLPLGDFHPHSTPPISDAKRELINISMPSELRFFRDWEAGDTEWPFCPCASSDLYTAYTRYCRKNGIPFPRDNAKFSGFAKTNMGWDKTHKSVHNSYHYESTPVRQRMILVSDKSLGEAAKRGMKDYRKTDEQSQVQWLTDCFLDFRGALNAENDEKAHGAHG